MKLSDQKQYELETFNGLYPLIVKLLSGVTPTSKVAEYKVNGVSFQIRQNGDLIEMGLPTEDSIFPTLTFKKLPNFEVELLHFRIGKEFKDAIFTATEMYVRGKPKVSLIFKKSLGTGINNEICYETEIPNMFTKNATSNITLSVEKLRHHKLSEYWDKQQPNANAVFANKIANMVIYYGDVEFGRADDIQSLQLTKEGVFIMWRVESPAYISSIANSFKQSNEVSLKVDLDEDDHFFAGDEMIRNAVINKISITFN